MEHLSRRSISDNLFRGTRSPDARKSRTSLCSFCTSSRGYSRRAPATAPNRRNKRRSIRYRPSAGWLEETLKTNLPWLNSQAPFELLWMDFLRSRAAYVRTHLDTLAAFAPKRCPSSAFIREPSPTAMTRDRFAPIVKPGAPYRPKRLRRSRPHAPVSYETLSGLRGPGGQSCTSTSWPRAVRISSA